jgi:TolA-binding protein
MVRVWIVVLAGTPLLAGCVTVAEFRKLEREVRNLQQEGTTTTGEERVRLADLAARLDGIEAEIERANGRLEVAEHRVDEALKEARAARAEAAEAAASTAGGAGAGAARPDPAAKATRSVELDAYRAARAAWSENVLQAGGLQDRRLALRRRRGAIPVGKAGSRRPLPSGRGIAEARSGLRKGRGQGVRAGGARVPRLGAGT